MAAGKAATKKLGLTGKQTTDKKKPEQIREAQG
jgi:hypothetical protein